MNCPLCDKPMIVFELDEVEVDHCVQCRGTWLDAGELELLLGGADDRDELLAAQLAPVESDEKPRRCPMCDRRMDKAVAGTEPAVTYDRCAGGDGLWFDRGELGVVLDHGRTFGEDGERVSAFLRDRFTEPPEAQA